MKITRMGIDYVDIDECNIADPSLLKLSRVHIIGLKFKIPTIEKVEYVLKTFRSTNRFVIEDNIKFYNDILKRTNKKYYVVNNEGDNLISFFKRNNKVLLNTDRLSILERAFVFSVSLDDVLANTEVIIVKEKVYIEHPEPFNSWHGNLILS